MKKLTILSLTGLLFKLFATPAHADVGLGSISGPGKFMTGGGSPGSQLEDLISTGIGALTVMAGLAFIIYFLYGAISYVTAGGKPDNTAKAQKTITDAAIGLIIVVITYFIVGIIGSILGLDILNPAKTLGL